MAVMVHNLFSVNGRWKYRKTIPKRLRPHIEGQITEYVRWLGLGKSTDSSILEKYTAASKDCERLIHLAQKRFKGQFDTLTDSMISHIVATEKCLQTSEDEDDRFDDNEDILFENVRQQLQSLSGGVPIATNPDRRFDKRSETAEAMLDYYRDCYAKGRITDIITHEALRICEDHELLVDPASLKFRRLCKEYIKAQIEILEIVLQRQEGKPIPTPPIPEDPLTISEEPQGETLRQLAEKKLLMNQKGYSTTEATETALKLFESVYGAKPMHMITRREVSEWIVLLQQKPAKPRNDHRLLGLQEQVKLYVDQKGCKRLTNKTINTHIGHLSSVWKWARARGYVDRQLDNPFTEQKLIAVRPEPTAGFTAGELKAIFDLPVFRSHERPRRGKGEAAFWVPLMLLTYGCRPEEVCQLLVSDIYFDCEETAWCIRITDEGTHPFKGDRSLKGAEEGPSPARRSLPIADSLLSLGFLDYVDGLRRQGETALFPLLRVKGKRNYLHESFGEWWRDYTRSHKAIPQSGNKPLRDFRATWTTAASRSGLTEEEREWIQGHYVSKAKTSNRTYGLREFGDRINKITYKNLDLSHLVADGALERAEQMQRRYANEAHPATIAPVT
jgi:integrase